MNKTWKIITALTLLVAFYAAQNPKAIQNIAREKALYDSLSYAYEITPEELLQMAEDREFEGRPYKKGGKNGN